MSKKAKEVELKEIEMETEMQEETNEQKTKRLFNEMNDLANPLYNWLINNFNENTSIIIKKGKIVVTHDLMQLNIVEEEKEDGITKES